MSNTQKAFITVISLIIFYWFTLPLSAQAQDVVRAEVDRTELTTDEYLTLSVIVNTALGTASEPRLPALEGFELAGTSTSRQLSIINGEISSEEIFHYTLRPEAPGDYIINPISVTQNGQVYETTPIKVVVYQGTGQMPTPPQSAAPGSPTSPSVPGFPSLPSIPGFPSLSGLLQNFGFDIPMDLQDNAAPLDPEQIPPELLENDYLVEAEIDNTSPYMGQQITFTFRYFRPASSAGKSTYLPPEFSGFWVHPEEEEAHYTGQFAGRSIRMTEIKTILTPTMVGKVEIDPAEISNEGDFYSRGFIIQTEPKTITVKPLPADAPASFSGAVGNFTISSKADIQQTRVNDAVTLTTDISGEGNLDTFGDPDWEISSQWRAFESQSSTEIQSQSGTLHGTRTIRQVLVPTKAGEYTIPAIEFSYFDPNSEDYRTIQSEPISISVEQNAQAESPILMQEHQNPSTLHNQLRPIKKSPQAGRVFTLIPDKTGFWLLWLVPFGILIAQAGWHVHHHNQIRNPGAVISRNAAKQADALLNQLDPSNSKFYNKANRILINYISKKLHRPVSGLTQADLSSLLRAHGASEELVGKVLICLTNSDIGQYAPIQEINAKELNNKIKEVISDLDKVL